MREPLTAVCYLAPGLPRAFFEALAVHLEPALGRPVRVVFDERSSGPMLGHHDPFAAGEADLGFLCSPSWLYLESREPSSVVLVPAGFVFADPRNGGQASYFSDVVVRTDHPARSFADLAGAAWGHNDGCSLSGYYSVLEQLAARGQGEDFFGSARFTGGHLASLALLDKGEIDAAAIDSNVLALARPDLAGLRVIESWGPYPIQPIVLRRELAGELLDPLTSRLLELGTPGSLVPALERARLERLIPIEPGIYDEEREVLKALGRL